MLIHLKQSFFFLKKSFRSSKVSSLNAQGVSSFDETDRAYPLWKILELKVSAPKILALNLVVRVCFRHLFSTPLL